MSGGGGFIAPGINLKVDVRIDFFVNPTNPSRCETVKIDFADATGGGGHENMYTMAKAIIEHYGMHGYKVTRIPADTTILPQCVILTPPARISVDPLEVAAHPDAMIPESVKKHLNKVNGVKFIPRAAAAPAAGPAVFLPGTPHGAHVPARGRPAAARPAAAPAAAAAVTPIPYKMSSNQPTDGSKKITISVADAPKFIQYMQDRGIGVAP